MGTSAGEKAEGREVTTFDIIGLLLVVAAWAAYAAGIGERER